MFEYYDNDFARGRLLGTIIRINDRAAYIENISGDQDLHYIDLESDTPGMVNIRDESVNVVPPKLGYISTGRGWKYVSRQPERRWKQGLPTDLLGIAMDNKTQRKALGKSLNGNYVHFNVAKRSVRCSAFSLHFAVQDGELMYKGEKVGTVSVEGFIALDQNKIFLKEYLEESLR